MRVESGVGALAIAGIVLFAACSSAPADPQKPAGSSGGFGNSSGGFGKPGGETPGGDGCSAEAKLVYVVSQEHDLYSFNPSALAFTKIGPIDCPAASTPNSMAIDRSGNAWVNYSDGSLFKVSTTTAKCEKTTFVPGQSGFVKFGMAFATNGEGSQDETLYVASVDEIGDGGRGLAKIDLSTMKLTVLGEYSGSLRGEAAELTGTGDGKLYGFFTTAPYATLAQIDKAQGATSGEKPLTGVSTGLAWAFSFWGGDFWFYTSNGVSPSSVTQLRASGNSEIKVVKENVGNFKIVGAGVSTCAPLTPPR
jgi:hypothetical protein